MSEDLLQNSLEDVIAQRAIPSGMLDDLLTIAKINDETCKKITSTISSLEGLNGNDAIEEAICEQLPNGGDRAAVKSVFRALINLNPESLDEVLDALDLWVEGDSQRTEVFTPSVVNQLRKNLRSLVADHPAIKLMKKADRLLRDVGNELDHVKFICDLRPVFDDPHEKVDGFVLIANMRLIYTCQDGSSKTCEIAMTENEIRNLRDEADDAVKKLDVLNEVRSTLFVNSRDSKESK